MILLGTDNATIQPIEHHDKGQFIVITINVVLNIHIDMVEKVGNYISTDSYY